MWIGIGIYVLVSIGIIAFLANKPDKFWVLFIIEVVLAIALVAVPTVASFVTTTQGAERVAKYEDADIFYDEADDEYFVVEENFCNFFKQHIRHEIDQARAVELVEAYETAQAQPFTKILTE